MGFDKDDVRQRAAGQWIAILNHFGMDAGLLDTKHHPCPKCGGTDRFRAFDDIEERGGVICNQCLKDESDGFGTIAWLKGWTFDESIQAVAEFLGMDPGKSKPAKAKPKDANPEEQVRITPWSDMAIPFFVQANPGIERLGIERSGCVQGSYQSKQVLLFRVIGEDLRTLTGYVAMSLISKTLPKYRKGEAPQAVRKLNVKGTKSGLIGEPSIRLLEAGGVVDVVWKVEGPTDLAALCSIIPASQWGRHVVVTTACGAGEKPRWISQFLCRAKAVYVVGDADEAGVRGADMWCEEVAACGGRVKKITLPYEVTPKSGKDLRDFILDGPEPWGRLLSLADRSPWLGAEERKPERTGKGSIPGAHQRCLDAIGLEVLCEDHQGIHLYSVDCRKVAKLVGPINRLSQEELIRVVGVRGESAISNDGEEGLYTMKQVRNAIAVAASVRNVDDAQGALRGFGVYRACDYEGQSLEAVVVANGTHLSVLNGDGILHRVDRPRYEGVLCKLGGRDWFDHDELADAVQKVKTDPEWVDAQWRSLISMIGRWTWKDQQSSPKILAGMIASTWVQDLWRWRPQVSIRGKSNVGKSQFVAFLFGKEGEHGIFGGISFATSLPTAAGVRQGVGRATKAICIDEFDSLREKNKDDILKLIRTAGPGDTITFGSAGHRAIEFGLRSITWLVGVMVGLDAQMDANRFLAFDLEKPPAERWKAWRAPTSDEKRQLMYSTLAIALVHGLRASQIASRIYQRVSSPIVPDRQIEGLAAPACLMALSLGGDEEDCVRLLESFVESVSLSTEQESQQDTHIELIEQILGLTINTGGQMQTTVGAILSMNDFIESEYRHQVEAQLGISRKDVTGVEVLAVHAGSLAKRVGIRKSEVSQLLRRVPGAFSASTKISKTIRHCTLIPWEWIDSTFYGGSEPLAF